MKKLFLTFSLLICTTLIFAQSTLKTHTDWLTTRLNKLVIDDDDKKLTVNDKKSKPVFSFAGNKMLMAINAKDEGFSMGFNISWSLKDVRKISYKKEKNGNYELVLDVPADRVKVDLGFGKDNNIGGSFNVKDDKSDSHTSFTLDTKDENVVKDITQHFESAIKEAKR
jgi:hypothetical protein